MRSARTAGATCASTTAPPRSTSPRWCTFWWRTRSTASASGPSRAAGAESIAELDRRLLLAARTRGHARWMERVAAAYSRTGEHAACWLALGLCGGWLAGQPGARAGWRRGMRVVAASYAANYAVKLVVRRPRPDLPA